MERVRQKQSASKLNIPPVVKKGVKQLLCAAAGLLSSKIVFSGELSPFGAALAGGCPSEYILASSIGSAIGSLLFCGPLNSLKYSGAITIMFLIRLFCEKNIRAGKRIYIYPLITFVSVLISSGIIMFAGSVNTAAAVLTVCEAIIAGAASCFIYRVFILLPSEKSAVSASPGDTASYLLAFALLLLGINSFPLFGFSPANVIAGFAVMLLSFCGKQASGTITGVCCGAVLSLSGEQPQLLLSLSLSGLVGGICCSYGKTAVAVSYIVSSSLALILKGSEETAVMALAEIITAAVIFEFIPVKLMEKLMTYMRPFSRDYFADEARQIIEMRIKKSAKAVRDISYSVEAVCRLLKKSDKPDISAVPGDVKDDVCANCTKRAFCWEENASLTQKSFEKSNKALQKLGRITALELDERLKIVCRSQSLLCDSFNRCYCEYNARLSTRNEIYDMKAVAASQFSCAAAILEDAAKNLDSGNESDTHLAAVISEVFEDEGFEFSSILVQNLPNERVTIEIFCTKIPKLPDYNSVLEKLSTKTNIIFMPPVADEYKDEGTVLCFCEKTLMGVDFYRCSHTSDGEKLCGDSCESFADGKGNYYCILSDGMGTGARAALDSVMTSSLMSRLMRAGFAMDTAFSAVNAALMVKSADETLATLDILQLDLYGGKASFYKAGGSFSVLQKNKRTAIVEKSSLPLGIIKDTKFEKSSVTLSKGDIIIMLSDGGACLAPEFFKEYLRKNADAFAKDIAEGIVLSAVKASPSGKCDDITAAVIKLT